MRRLRPIRRPIFALYRAFWDAIDAVGDHMLFAALSVVTLAVLTLVFVSRGDGLSALWGLAAVWGVFLVFVALKFVQALAHPDRHRDWEWVDYGIQKDLWLLGIKSLAPLSPHPLHQTIEQLQCRVIAPDGTLWKSYRPPDGGTWARGPTSRSYLEDFTCPKCGQSPPRILSGEYEVTWLQPWRGPIRRPLLRYGQRAPEFEQAPESSEPAS